MLFQSYCERHRETTLVEVEPLRPLGPPDKYCVVCIDERLGRTQDAPQVTVVPYTGTRTRFETTRGPLDPDSLPPRLRQVYIRQLAAQKEAGRVVAGSVEEEHVLAEMDASRPESVWYDHASVAERRRRAQRQRRRGYVTPAFREMS